MNILILGATSQTGQALLKRFSTTIHAVTAYVRSPEKLPSNPDYQIIKGDLLDASHLTEAMQNIDIIIAGLSGDTIDIQARNIVSAAMANNIKHIYWITGVGIHREITGLRGEELNKYLNSMPEYAQAADIIAESDISSTLLRLPAVVNGPATDFEITLEGQQPHGTTINRDTLAEILVTLLADPTTQYDNASLALNNK